MTMGEKLDVAQVLLCDARDLRNKEITRADMGLKRTWLKITLICSCPKAARTEDLN